MHPTVEAEKEHLKGASYAFTLFTSLPTPDISTTTSSPGLMGPTPGGVPVAMISPGRRVITCETKETISETGNIMFFVVPFCLSFPFR